MVDKLKQPLFYTLAHCWGCGRGYRVLAVTTVKRTQYFGRYVDHNESTHRATHQCTGRFTTAETAEACIKGVESIREQHAPRIKTARLELRDAESSCDREVNEFIKAKGSA